MSKFLEKRIKDVIDDDRKFASKVELYANYCEPDRTGICYVMTSDTDVTVCERDQVKLFKRAGFAVFGITHSEKQLCEMVERAECS